MLDEIKRRDGLHEAVEYCKKESVSTACPKCKEYRCNALEGYRPDYLLESCQKPEYKVCTTVCQNALEESKAQACEEVNEALDGDQWTTAKSICNSTGKHCAPCTNIEAQINKRKCSPLDGESTNSVLVKCDDSNFSGCPQCAEAKRKEAAEQKAKEEKYKQACKMAAAAKEDPLSFENNTSFKESCVEAAYEIPSGCLCQDYLDNFKGWLSLAKKSKAKLCKKFQRPRTKDKAELESLSTECKSNCDPEQCAKIQSKLDEAIKKEETNKKKCATLVSDIESATTSRKLASFKKSCRSCSTESACKNLSASITDAKKKETQKKYCDLANKHAKNTKRKQRYCPKAGPDCEVCKTETEEKKETFNAQTMCNMQKGVPKAKWASDGDIKEKCAAAKKSSCQKGAGPQREKCASVLDKSAAKKDCSKLKKGSTKRKECEKEAAESSDTKAKKDKNGCVEGKETYDKKKKKCVKKKESDQESDADTMTKKQATAACKNEKAKDLDKCVAKKMGEEEEPKPKKKLTRSEANKICHEKGITAGKALQDCVEKEMGDSATKKTKKAKKIDCTTESGEGGQCLAASRCKNRLDDDAESVCSGGLHCCEGELSSGPESSGASAEEIAEAKAKVKEACAGDGAESEECKAAKKELEKLKGKGGSSKSSAKKGSITTKKGSSYTLTGLVTYKCAQDAKKAAAAKESKGDKAPKGEATTEAPKADAPKPTPKPAEAK